ncbi:hypothetical protein [Streptococcus sp. DD11]|uniref:hypothetical protein n=1 Tax=Streptococcus sp. DD11 TaxID=1777879 RepID=UPI000ABBEF0F|nr:hypothetical protein [Streptococcus sp. DD11]
MTNKIKHDEFYFEVDKVNHELREMIDFYSKYGRAKLDVKYEGKIYCSICKQAPLNINFGPKRKGLSVLQQNQSKHLDGCSKAVEEANKKETNQFYSESELDKSHINKRLELLIHSLFNSKKLLLRKRIRKILKLS